MMSKLVPKLRFKEFSEDWEEIELGKLGEFKGGGTPSKQIDEYWKGDIPWISSSDINKDNLHYININKFINKKSIKESATKIIPRNSVLFVSRVGVGKLAINENELCTSQDFTNFTPKETNSYYLGYFFIANKNIFESFNQGTSIKGFTKIDIETLKIKIPKLKEQEKIAKTLTSLDSLIEAENKKVETLKRHKKGLMQNLFPLDGEKEPKLRFDGFCGDWEEKTLENLSNITMGSSPKSSFYNKNKEGVPLLQGNADIKNRKSYPRIYTTQITKECFENDILLSVRAPVGTVAKSNHYACIGRGISSIKAKKDNSQEWIYQWFLQFENRWSSISQGGTFEAVNSSDIKNLNILIPKLKEQQKIANTLSSLDNLIEVQTKKVETLKQHKKGLMQKLFVNKEEN